MARLAAAAALAAALAVTAVTPSAVAAARTAAPWSISSLRPALRSAKLQAPTVSKKDVKDLKNYKAPHFYAQDGAMVFQMAGDGARSELRFIDEWSVASSRTRRMVGQVSLPRPSSQMEQFTWMQVHGGSKGKKPLLRLSWHRKRTQYGKRLSNVLLATVRLNNRSGDGNTVVYELGKRPSGRFTADVRVKRSRLTVRIDGRTKVDADVGYWKYPTNYFKAGVYIQEGRSTATVVYHALSVS